MALPNTCAGMLKLLLSDNKFSPVVERFKGKNIEFTCEDCPKDGVQGRGRAYFQVDGDKYKIVMCKNRAKVDDIGLLLSHEITHAYDYIFENCDMATCQGDY